jgi:uncharacterized membrane protein
MSTALTTILSISMVGYEVLAFRRAFLYSGWPVFVLETFLLATYALWLHWLFQFPFPERMIAKGHSDELILVLALYLCMLLGMLSQLLHKHFSIRRAQRLHKRIDWGQFLAAAFASPIVFVPLLVALLDAHVDFAALTAARMMVFFVAFQNGFFWQEHFERNHLEIG